eukprot:403339215
MENLQKLIRCLVNFTIQTYNPEYFDYSKKLGQGSQATVYKVKSTQELKQFLTQEQINKKFALKQVDKNQQGVQLECVKREINIMRKISQDPYVVRLITVFESEDTLYLLMEYKRGGNLKDLIKTKGCLSEIEAKIITYQILKALSSIHKKSIIHRDLTPVNILFDQKQNNSKKYNFNTSLADFGLSITLEDLMNENIRCGTPGYMAPESIKNCKFSLKSDIFSVGCLLFRMLTGENIFQGINSMEILKSNVLCRDLNKIIENKLGSFTQYCRDVVSQCLNIKAEKRPESEEALQNIWFLKSKIIILTNLNKNGSYQVKQNKSGNLLAKKEVLNSSNQYPNRQTSNKANEYVFQNTIENVKTLRVEREALHYFKGSVIQEISDSNIEQQNNLKESTLFGVESLIKAKKHEMPENPDKSKFLECPPQQNSHLEAKSTSGEFKRVDTQQQE